MAIKALIILFFIFGGVTWLATAGILLIFALGSNKAKPWNRIGSSIISIFMFWGFIYVVMWLIQKGGF